MRTRAVLVGCGLLLAGSVACSGQPDTPGNAVIAYALDVQTGDFEAAHERLCDDLQDEVSVEDLEQGRADELVPINPLDSVRLTREETLEDVRSPTQVVIGDLDGVEQSWDVGLVQEDGRWRLCTFSRSR